MKDLNSSSNNKAGATKNLSRKHVVESRPSGLLSLMGGKWTIQRLMAQDTVDALYQNLIDRNLITKD